MIYTDFLFAKVTKEEKQSRTSENAFNIGTSCSCINMNCTAKYLPFQQDILTRLLTNDFVGCSSTSRLIILKTIRFYTEVK